MTDPARAAEALLRLALDEQIDAAILYDEGGRVAFVNEAYHRFFPHMPSVRDMIGMTFDQVIRHSMEEPGVVVDPLAVSDPDAYVAKRWARFRDPLPTPWIQETKGRYHLVRERHVPGVGFFSLRTDITAMKEAEQALRTALDEAGRAKLLQDRMVSILSHELRTPASAIATAIELAEGDSAFAPEALRIGAESARLILGILDDLRLVTRIDDPEIEANAETVDLRALFEASLAGARVEASRKGIALVADLDRIDGWHEADGTKIRQIVQNLVGNALRFSDRGRITVSAAVADGPTGAVLRFFVRDTGPGIAVADRERIFEPFFQTADPRSRAHGGSGLGLFICKRLTEVLGGQIHVESRIGTGTTFHVVLPVRRGAPPAVSPPAAATSEPRSVLLVEDSPTGLALMQALSGTVFATVDSATSGPEALALAARKDYDLILLDYMMPGLSGAETAIRLRAAGCRSTIVGITAATLGGERDECLRAGMDEVFAKPLTRATLQRCMELTRLSRRG